MSHKSTVPLRDTQMGADASPPPLSPNRRKCLTQVLVRGHESATHLHILLRSPPAADQPSAASALAAKISSSFTQALSILADEDSVSSDLDSKHPRPSHKKRKASPMRIVVSPTVEDGHAWRKYGQKPILNAKHPRCYYRCSHKFDEGCEASKQVQRTEADSELFKITYIGHHTCRLPPPINCTDSDDPLSTSYISFSEPDNNPPDTTSRLYWPADDDTAAKGDNNRVSKEETTSGLTDNLSSFDDTDLWSDFKDFGNLPETTTPDCDYGDAMSNGYSFSVQDEADKSLIFGKDFGSGFPL